jgi:hypothetical protein
MVPVEVVEPVGVLVLLGVFDGVAVAVAVEVHSIVHVLLDRVPPFKQE